jgi:hypothetical protein
MNGEFYLLGHLAEVVTDGNEREMRKLLNDAGADPPFDEHIEDPLEKVPIQLVMTLALLCAEDQTGPKLAELMSGEVMYCW